MMKRRSKPAISRVRLDGRSKDERYRTDNSRARARARASCRCSFRANLLPRLNVSRKEEAKVELPCVHVTPKRVA